MGSKDNITILHIGYSKTGTTWFQEKFYPKVKDIEFYGIKRRREVLKLKWREVKNTEKIQNLFKINSKGLVICDESMVGRGRFIEYNAEILKKSFYPAQIIIFIRNQLDQYISTYSQYIKSGGTARFEDYLFQGSDLILGQRHLYDKVIGLYKKHFGPMNVYVYLYEDFNLNFNSFITTFCNKHRFDIDLNYSNQLKVNPRLSKNLLKLKRISNKFTNQRPYELNLLSDKKCAVNIPYWHQISSIGFEKLNKYLPFSETICMEDLIGAKRTQVVKDYFSESNQRLIDDHGLYKIKEYNYPL